jgi:Secretion system C-terminal sorting domain
VTYLCFTNVTYVVDFSVVLTLRGINLTGINAKLDKEIMSPYAQSAKITASSTIIISASNRTTLTTGGGESLKGAKRIFTDSKTTIWSDLFVNTFTKPIYTLSLSNTSPLQSTLCGYGSKNTTSIIVATNSTTPPSYFWQYKLQDSISNTISDKPNVFKGNYTNTISITNTDPTLAGNFNIHKMKVYCKIILEGQGCAATSDTFSFKASSANIILSPALSRCVNDPTNWTLPTPTPTPTNGVFTAYNITSPAAPISNILQSTAATTVTLNKTKFPIASTYKLIYTSADSLCADETYMSTYDNCNTLGTNHKLYINEVYRYGTAYRNGGVKNNPCDKKVIHFTAMGTYAIGDTIQAKLSNGAGVVDNTIANIRQKMIGTYVFKAALTNSAKTDSMLINNLYAHVAVQSDDYRIQLYLRKKGINTTPEWGDINQEKLSFKVSSTCAVQIPPPCNPCISGRLAPTHFTPEEIALYPNPTTDRFTLQIPEYEAATEVLITDIQGRIIDKRSLYSSINEIETNELPNGIYFVRIAQGERSTVLKLVIVK